MYTVHGILQSACPLIHYCEIVAHDYCLYHLHVFPTQDVPNEDGEIMTPTVENTANPVFDHASELRLSSPDAWGRVCAPSAALVFRVWRRARCSWWDAAQTGVTSASRTADAPLAGLDQGSAHGIGVGRGEAVPLSLGARLGDKLIGSAVVGLEVLRATVGAATGGGLREIDGWYHVLDDLQRPQGQLKVHQTRFFCACFERATYTAANVRLFL